MDRDREIERLKTALDEAVRSFTRMETLYKVKCNAFEAAQEATRRGTAKEILDEVSKHYGGAWLVELYKKYGVCEFDTFRLISINKPYTDLIFDGKKRIEWRKGKGLGIGRYYVYETENKGGCGRVIGEFDVPFAKQQVSPYDLTSEQIQLGCVPCDRLVQYAGDGDLVALYIGSATRYETPKPLSDFYRPCKRYAEMGDGKDVGCYDYCENIPPEGEDCYGNLTIRRPPQSWCYVNKYEEKRYEDGELV